MATTSPYEEFKELSHQIGLVNHHLAASLAQMHQIERRPIDRVNDAALIIFHIFAFEDFCRHYVTDKFSGKRLRSDPRSGLLKNIRRAAISLRRVRAIWQTLRAVDQIMMIRDIYAHRLGRRRGLKVSRFLTPKVLKRYGFETDGRDNDPHARWWPRPFASFSACVGPLKELAAWVHANLTTRA